MGRQLVVIIQEHAARDAAAGGATCQQSKKKGEAGWGEIHAVPGPAAASACCPLHVATLACILVYLRSSCMRARCGERTARGLDHVPTQVFRKPFQGERATRAHPPRTHTHTTPFSRDMTVLHMRISTERHLGAPLRARAYLCQQPQPLGGRVCACDLVCVEAQRELPGGARGRREVEELAIHALGGPQGQRHTR